MELSTVWFILIAVLWIGYFTLEGFDFGVGTLLPFLAKNDKERRVMINTIGPVWDGNEVWLLTAGGATFAAFPYWYATLFSGYFLALVVILLALIARGVAFEYRAKHPSATWRKWWDVAIFLGSAVPALLWGVAFGNIVGGSPLTGEVQGGDVLPGTVEFDGTFFSLLNPYALLGGLVTLGLFLTHGAMFTALKTDGDIRHRARALSVKLGLGTAVVAVVFLVWTQLSTGNIGSAVFFVLGAVALLAGVFFATKGAEGKAFAGNFAAIALAVAGLFVALFPDVMPGDDALYSLTTTNASSTDYTLTVMTIVAVIFTPIVLAYQAWTYWVFRRRISTHHIPDETPEPVGATS